MGQVCPLYCRLLVCTVVGSLLCACSTKEDNKDELVVEGWICQDGHPVVLIHQSYAFDDPKHSNVPDDASFEDVVQDQLIVWGRVTIDDGDEQIVMTGRLDTLYTPPFIYTTTYMTGEVGKTYRITVDYEDYHATAYSTIQEPIGLDSIVVRLVPETKTSHLSAYMSHLPQECYFLLEYRSDEEKQFIMCPLGTASSEQVKDGVLSFNILSRDSVKTVMTSALHNFVTNDREYVIRLIRIDKEQYVYFTALSSQLASQGMFFVSAYKNIPTNISGGIGYWAGFGKKDYRIHINKDTTYRLEEQ